MGQREIISSVNRREAHTPFGGYETFEQAKARDNSQSQAILPLDGLWPFAAYPAAEDVPAGWASPTGEELAALPTMPVPSCCGQARVHQHAVPLLPAGPGQGL